MRTDFRCLDRRNDLCQDYERKNKMRSKWKYVVGVLFVAVCMSKPFMVLGSGGLTTNYPILDTITVGVGPSFEDGRTLVVHSLSPTNVAYTFQVVTASDVMLSMSVIADPNLPILSPVLSMVDKKQDAVTMDWVADYMLTFQSATGTHLIDIVATDSTGTLKPHIRRKS